MLALCRRRTGVTSRNGCRGCARVLAPPVVGKVEVAAKLCTANGVELAKVPHRDKAAYAKARRWRWGDALSD